MQLTRAHFPLCDYCDNARDEKKATQLKCKARGAKAFWNAKWSESKSRYRQI